MSATFCLLRLRRELHRSETCRRSCARWNPQSRLADTLVGFTLVGEAPPFMCLVRSSVTSVRVMLISPVTFILLSVDHICYLGVRVLADGLGKHRFHVVEIICRDWWVEELLALLEGAPQQTKVL